MNKTGRRFHVASEDELRAGQVTDVYFVRTEEAIAHRGADAEVVAEMRARRLPKEWAWGVLAGVEEVARLLEGMPIDVWSLPEGTVFRPGDPVLTIRGRYGAFGRYETEFLGLLCQASGIATKAARCRLAAGERTLLSFGARRMHPSIAPMIERACYVGGCDGVSTVLAADVMGIAPTGTMPHALVLLIGDTVEAAWAFHEAVDEAVPRIVLIDTLADEKFETLRVAEAMGDLLHGVRLDTPSSRRGDLGDLMREVRWELDLRGHDHVKLYASGGLDEYAILGLNGVCDGYGVGTSLANAPTVNFAFDIVEIEGKPFAKRGKMSGAKFLARCPSCGASEVMYWKREPGRCACGQDRMIANQRLIAHGELVADMPLASDIRQRVLVEIEGLDL